MYMQQSTALDKFNDFNKIKKLEGPGTQYTFNTVASRFISITRRQSTVPWYIFTCTIDEDKTCKDMFLLITWIMKCQLLNFWRASNGKFDLFDWVNIFQPKFAHRVFFRSSACTCNLYCTCISPPPPHPNSKSLLISVVVETVSETSHLCWNNETIRFKSSLTSIIIESTCTYLTLNMNKILGCFKVQVGWKKCHKLT